MDKAVKLIAMLGLLLLFSNGSYADSLFSSSIRAGLGDQDKDGVIDARDLCPNTEPGAAVDNNGCPKESSKLLSVELNILFDTGKAVVRPRYYSEVMKLADFLKSHSNSNVVIEGYTDNVGSPEANRELSQKRATAIADILVDSFRIAQNRVKAIGYGESQPIAGNETPEGRMKNRRVMAEVFAKEQSDVMRWTIYSVDKNNDTAFNTPRP